MAVSQEDINKILLHFLKLSKESRSMSYSRDLRKYQLRDKNAEVLKAFFRSVRVSFEDADKREEFQRATDLYFYRLLTNPIYDKDVVASVYEIQTLLYEQRDNILYGRFLSILSEYSMD